MRPLLQGREERTGREADSRQSHSDPDTDTLCPQSQAVAAPRPTGPGLEGGRNRLGMEEL